MKKRVLMSLVVLAIIGTSAVFAQTAQQQGKYHLEVWNISQAAYDRLKAGTLYEDAYFAARSASGTSVRIREDSLTLEQVRQKLLDVIPRNAAWTNYINNNVPFSQIQQYGVICGWISANQTRILYWIRRQE